MSFELRRLARRLTWLVPPLVVAATALGGAPVQAAPAFSLDERATAIASPSLVYLETLYSGYLRDKTTDAPLLASPVTYSRRCSGFVVNPNGYVVTTRVCVAPPAETILQQVLYVAGFREVGEGKLDRANLAAWVNAAMATTVFTGQNEGSNPDVVLVGQLNVATAGTTDPPAVPGKVVTSDEPADGNVAVVKLDQANLPAVELHNAALDQGASVLTIGFDTTDTDPLTGTYTAQTKTVKVVGTGTRGSAPFYKIDTKLGIYEHGGMALDPDGKVVGMVDEDPASQNNENRVVMKVDSIDALLSKAGVKNTLGANDQRYRKGLDAYFTGDYATAVTLLDQTAKAVPANHVARTYQQYAVEHKRLQGNTTNVWSWLVPVLAGVAGAVLATVLVLVLMGRRRRRPAAPVTYAPPPPPPPAPVPPAPQPQPVAQEPVAPVSAPPNRGSLYERPPWFQEVPVEPLPDAPTIPVPPSTWAPPPQPEAPPAPWPPDVHLPPPSHNGQQPPDARRPAGPGEEHAP